MDYFFFSDVHGEYYDLMTALKESGYVGAAHQKLVSLGDNFDRGAYSKEMLIWLTDNMADEKLISVKGNHDCNLQALMSGHHKWNNKVDIYNGVLKTLGSFANKNFDETKFYTQPEIDQIFAEFSADIKMRLTFLFKESVWGIRNKDFFGVHGWIPNTKFMSRWEDAVWANTESIVAHPQWYLPANDNHVRFIVGHWYAGFLRQVEDKFYPNEHVSYVSGQPYFSRGGRIIALDGCVNVFHHVNIFVVHVDDNDTQNYFRLINDYNLD